MAVCRRKTEPKPRWLANRHRPSPAQRSCARWATSSGGRAGGASWAEHRGAGGLSPTSNYGWRSLPRGMPPIRLRAVAATGVGWLAPERAAGIRQREAPGMLLVRGLRRSEAAALTMGHVERRDGPSCVEGRRVVDSSTAQTATPRKGSDKHLHAFTRVLHGQVAAERRVNRRV